MTDKENFQKFKEAAETGRPMLAVNLLVECMEDIYSRLLELGEELKSVVTANRADLSTAPSRKSTKDKVQPAEEGQTLEA